MGITIDRGGWTKIPPVCFQHPQRPSREREWRRRFGHRSTQQGLCPSYLKESCYFLSSSGPRICRRGKSRALVCESVHGALVGYIPPNEIPQNKLKEADVNAYPPDVITPFGQKLREVILFEPKFPNAGDEPIRRPQIKNGRFSSFHSFMPPR